MSQSDLQREFACLQQVLICENLIHLDVENQRKAAPIIIREAQAAVLLDPLTEVLCALSDVAEQCQTKACLLRRTMASLMIQRFAP